MLLVVDIQEEGTPTVIKVGRFHRAARLRKCHLAATKTIILPSRTGIIIYTP